MTEVERLGAQINSISERGSDRPPARLSAAGRLLAYLRSAFNAYSCEISSMHAGQDGPILGARAPVFMEAD